MAPSLPSSLAPAPLPRVVGILGAGRAGTSLARAIARVPRLTGEAEAPRVLMATQRRPAALQRHLAVYAPAATAVTAEELAAEADLVVVAVPREALDDVDPALLAGPRTVAVVDATNTWEDEPLPAWLAPGAGAEVGGADDLTGTERIVRRWAAAGLAVPVVRAFSEISHHDLDRQGVGTDGSNGGGRAETLGRRALAVGADEPGPGQDAVAGLVAALGYAPVPYTPLRRGRLVEPGAPGFGQAWTAPDLRAALDAAD